VNSNVASVGVSYQTDFRRDYSMYALSRPVFDVEILVATFSWSKASKRRVFDIQCHTISIPADCWMCDSKAYSIWRLNVLKIWALWRNLNKVVWVAKCNFRGGKPCFDDCSSYRWSIVWVHSTMNMLKVVSSFRFKE